METTEWNGTYVCVIECGSEREKDRTKRGKRIVVVVVMVVLVVMMVDG